ncbi:MAG: hypothetical protein JWR80_734 [Bradyrhizobium sp.]|nr:hypothetical protein [Bradyrhizobium sp.]
MNSSMCVRLMALLLAGTSSVAAAQAQDQPVTAGQSATNDANGDILVTARRTSERLQDVPVAVTAIGAGELVTAQIRSLTDVQRLSPSLSITPINGVGTSATVAIRGQVQTTAGIGVDPSTGVYINEVYVARPAGLDAAVFDVANVQVLKGPQGTLFGRNSVGGAVLIETQKPRSDFGGYLDASLQTPYGYTLEGALNVPLGHDIALRVAGLRQYTQGYTTVINQNFKLDDRNRWAGRATLQGKFGGFNTALVGDYFHSDANGPAGFPLAPNTAIAVSSNPIYATYIADYNASLTRDFHSTQTSGPVGGKATTGGLSDTSTLELTPHFTLKNIVGFRWQKSNDFVDLDGSVATVQYVNVRSTTHQFSEELQLQSSLFDDSLSLIAGGYYFSEAGYDRSESYTRVPQTSIARNQNRFYAINKSWSGFAHASYTLPIGVPAHIFGGIRYTEDKREIHFESQATAASGAVTCTVVGTPVGVCRLDAQKTFPATTWDAGVDIKPVGGLMFYGSVSRGYRTGGFNGRATTVVQQAPFEPEFVTSYETGAKLDWHSGGLRGTFNLAAYYADYTNIQRATIVTSGSSVSGIVINAAKARIKGLEAEASIHFSPDLSLRGFWSVTDAAYKQFLIGTTDLSANQFSFVPKYQAGATLDWEFAKTGSSGEFGLDLNYSHKSGYFLDVVNFPGAQTRPYDIANATLRWDHVLGGRLSASVFVNNLFDSDYDVGGFSLATTLGVAEVMRGAPRVVGLSLHLPFGGE